ncbi:MAG: O-antigen ligase family protein, partial [Planctomycetes bacterium]|nr:O-antigen ligase family protein [Planctomycetota bacterium]
MALAVIPLCFRVEIQDQTELPKRIVASMVVWLALGLSWLFGRGDREESLPLVIKLAIGLVVWTLWVWGFAYRPRQGVDAVLMMLESLGWMILAWRLSRWETFRRWLAPALIVPAGLAAVVGHFQFGTEHPGRFYLDRFWPESLDWWQGKSHSALVQSLRGVQQTDAPGSLFGHANIAGEWVALGFCFLAILLAGRLWSVRTPKASKCAWLLVSLPLLGAMGLFIVETGSRAVALALVVLALLVWLDRFLWGWRHAPWFSSRVGHVLAHGLLALTLGAGLVAAGHEVQVAARHGQTSQTAWNRLRSSFDERNTSVAERLVLWTNTAAIVQDHPVFGVGPGNFRVAYPAYAQSRRQHETGQLRLRRQPEKPHNEYLHVAAELGWPGLALFLAVIIGVLGQGWRAVSRSRKEGDDRRATCLTASLAVILLLLMISFVAFPLRQTATRVVFWVLAGVLIREASVWRPPRLRAPGRGRPLAIALVFGLLLVSAAHFRASYGASRDLRLVSGWRATARLVRDGGYFLRRGELIALDRAVARRPDRYDIELMRADLLVRMGRPLDAEASFLRALDLHPWLVNAEVGLSKLAVTMGQVDEALRRARRAVALNPEDAHVRLVLGRAWMAAGETVAAATEFTRALQLRPDPAERLQAHIEMASLLNEADRLTGASYHLEQAQLLGPNELVLIDLQARFLERRSPGSMQAFEAWTRLMEANPDHALAKLQVGRGLLSAGQPEAALSTLDEAFALDGLRPAILYERGRALLMLGRLQEARDSLLECMQRCVRIHRDEFTW